MSSKSNSDDSASQPGKLFILSGPSGSGKSTVIARALQDAALPVRLAISATTRPPRPGEIPGRHYHFWSHEQFEQGIQEGRFLEWADVYGHRYGTLKDEVEPYLRQGQSVLLEVDVQGGMQIRQVHPDAILVFIRTSSLESYEQRLRQRRTDNETSMQKRLASAARELQVGQHHYQYQIINDDLEQAVQQLKTIMHSRIGGIHAG